MKRPTFALAVVVVVLTAGAMAHHAPMSLGTVRLSEPVMVGGTLLQPGTYEIRDTGEHPAALPGQSPDAQAQIEFVAAGKVVARDLAEVMPLEQRAVGTSGAVSSPVVQRLRGNEFLRISVNTASERYLIHLPLGGNQALDPAPANRP